MKSKSFVIMALIVGNVFSQIPDESINSGVWENIYNGDISNNGEWFFLTSQYQTKIDTLRVMKTTGKKAYKIPNGKEGLFTKNNRFFIAYSKDSQIQIIDLKNDSISKVKDVQSRYFSFDERFLILLKKGETYSELLIKHLGLGTEIIISHVLEFQINPLKNEIALILENKGEFSVRVLDLNSYTIEDLHKNDHYPYKNLIWTANGSRLTFMGLNSRTTLNNSKIISCSGLECQEVDFESIENITGQKFRNDFLDISTGGDFIYFKCMSAEKPKDTVVKGIQIWETTDKWIYPRREKNNLLGPQPYLWSWMPDKNKIGLVTDTIKSKIIKVNKDYILKYDELSYEPQYNFIADVDIYLHNLNSGNSELLIKKLKPNELFINPNGQDIVFFQKQNWWVYNIKQKSFKNLTEALSMSFCNLDNDHYDKKRPFSKRIKWIEEEQAILVCDEYDVWKLGLDGETKIRLTKGREIQRNYSLVFDFANPKRINQNRVNLLKGFLLLAEDEDRNTGYFLWQADGKLKELSFGAFQVDEIKCDVDMHHFTFRIQAYDSPPEILFYDRFSEIKKSLYLSNKKRPISEWGQTVLMPFTLKNGKTSKVCLIYPVNYNPELKYPMIVNIYEKKTKKMHEFYPISWYSEIGFNPTHYALDGYFVLLPDIEYTIGNVGVSANQYVNESVDFVLQKANIDKNKIGLIGHSFGGFETAFVVTQTDRFVAAVVGSAVTDIITYYHTINWLTGQEQMSRFEDFQMRMGNSYFEIKENYKRNSPFHNVENILTPLLLWSGGNDLHVDFHQSIRFYLALRRLGKTAQLLLFENEEHVLLDQEKKVYLSQRIKKWFDNYCK